LSKNDNYGDKGQNATRARIDKAILRYATRPKIDCSADFNFI